MFARSYSQAREIFISATSNANYSHKQYIMPNQNGPENETLSTDVAYHITPATKKLLIVSSGTHGIEGYYGSAVQSLWLENNKVTNLPQELGVLFIHALNPYGFARGERVDQSEVDDCGKRYRVDPNRNFIDFGKPLPENPNYTTKFESLLVPNNWYGWGKYITTVKLLMKYLQDKITHSYHHMIYPTMAGQYISPQGFSYGGNHPSWSNRILREIVADFIKLEQLDEVVFIDLHTGVGQYGKIEAYSVVAEDKENHLRTKAWLHDLIKTIPSPYPVSGSTVDAMLDYFASIKITGFALECGTESPITVLNALRAQNWLDKFGSNNFTIKEEIKQNMKAAFYPDSNDWRDKVTHTTMQVFNRIIAKLTQQVDIDYTPQHGKWCKLFPQVTPSDSATNEQILSAMKHKM